MEEWPEMWSRRMWCKPGGWSNWLNGSILIVIKPLVLTHPLFSKMQGKHLSWTDIQGEKILRKTCNKDVTIRLTNWRGEPFWVLWFRFEHPLQFLKLTQSAVDLRLFLDYSNFNTSLYTTHSYFLTTRHNVPRLCIGSCCESWLYYGSKQSWTGWVNEWRNLLSMLSGRNAYCIKSYLINRSSCTELYRLCDVYLQNLIISACEDLF